MSNHGTETETAQVEGGSSQGAKPNPLEGSYDSGTQTGTLSIEVPGDLEIPAGGKITKKMTVTLEKTEIIIGGVKKKGLRLTIAD